MRFRTLALALALGCGLTVVGEARQNVPVQRPKPRKARKIKPRKIKKIKPHKVHRTV